VVRHRPVVVARAAGRVGAAGTALVPRRMLQETTSILRR
jgi:hypothetical protein